MTDDTTRKSFWRSRTFYAMLTFCVAILLLSAWVFLLRVPPLVISEKTTQITGPLTADGEIDFLKALEQRVYPPELTTDDNGFRVFVRQFGDVGELAGKEFYRLQKYEKLGLDPNVPPTLKMPRDPFVIVKESYATRGEEVPAGLEDEWRNRPWTLEQFPMLADWITESDAPLDALAEAIRKPIFCPPLLQGEGSFRSGKPQNLLVLLLPDIMYSRTMARLFQARAAYRIGTGNIDGAIDDKLTLHRLGRLIGRKRLAVEHIVGIAIERIAASLPIGADPDCPLTEKQIRRLLDGLDTLPPRASLQDVNEVERLTALSCIQDVMRERSPLSEIVESRDSWTSAEILAYSCNWNIVFRRMNEMYDAMLEEPPRTRFNELVNDRSFSENFLKLCWTPNSRGDLIANYFITLFAPGMEAFDEAIHRSECMENMQRLALAILLYQYEHGTLPDEHWASQIEKYLGENPGRSFSCPSNPSPGGETTYAMVQYGKKQPDDRDTILLVESGLSVSLDKAVVSVDEVLERHRTGGSHPGGMVIAYRSGAVRFLASTVEESELRRLLGR